ncbi:MAG: S9 family peptidase [Saprospiraceae bacterium]|nr:S9 family peptidase [Saprospiraceae bacterium]
MKAPAPKKISKLLEIHQDTRHDPYYWMRDLDDPDTMSYLKAENAYGRNRLKHTEALQETIYQEIIGRIKQDDQSVPYRKNGYWYQTRYLAGSQHPQFWRWPDNNPEKEQLLWDAEKAGKDQSYYQIASRTVSSDNRYYLFGEDRVGRRLYTLRIKDLVTGELLDEAIPHTSGSGVWSPDGQSFYYTVKDDKLRSCRIRQHVLGTPADQDIEIYFEADETYSSFVYKTKSEQFIVIVSSSTVSDEFRYLNCDHPEAGWSVFLPRKRHHEYSIYHHKEHFYIRTNWNATNFKLMRCTVGQTNPEDWEEVIPHDPAGYLEDVEVFENHLAILSRANATKEVRIIDLQSMQVKPVEFAEEARSIDFDQNPEYQAKQVRIQYTSLITPPSVIDIGLEDGLFTIRKVQEVVGGYQPEKYHSERIWVKADDGTNIPVSLVYRKDKWRKGASRGLLYGYGSYGISIDPYFSIPRLSLLDRGFVYAIAHIRGGQELGRDWYDQGKLKFKLNTFTDFIACGKALINRGYVCPAGLGAMGGSAGGLLMGTVMNMAPELFRAMVAAVPFVDVVTTMLDDSIPLTTGEYDEWGNPNDPEYYELMKSYSPYDNISGGPYPSLLVTAGLHDSQVQYWEPAKWVAKLRDYTNGNSLIVLHTNLEAGHSGASGRFERHHETALEFAFIIDQVICTPTDS